jgi:hypothetical protein
VGDRIAKCRLLIFDWRSAQKQLAIGNRKSTIATPTRYHVVVLTPFHCGFLNSQMINEK